MASASHPRQYVSQLPLAVLALVIVALLLQSPVTAASSMPISGYVWSSNVGWISFSGPGYGVFEDTTTRALSGYAWSSNIGWISFSASDGSHPAPAVDIITGGITGWARACAAFADKNACSGALDSNTGGWDGWIALSGTATDGSPYGMVQETSCAWTGYAWGSDAIGWISASGTATDGSAYGVSGNDPSACGHSCTATITADPDTVEQGENVTLAWSVSGGSLCASSCTGSGFSTGGRISGSRNTVVSDPPPSASYALTCTGGTYGPPPPVNVTVAIIAPEASITANGQSTTARVDPTVPNNTTIAWSSDHTSSCTVSKNGTTWKNGRSSPGVTDTVTEQTVYEIDCRNNGGVHATDSVIVNVSPDFREF